MYSEGMNHQLLADLTARHFIRLGFENDLGWWKGDRSNRRCCARRLQAQYKSKSADARKSERLHHAFRLLCSVITDLSPY